MSVFNVILAAGIFLCVSESFATCYVIYGPDGETSKEYDTSPIDLSVSISDGLLKCGLDGYSMVMLQGLCTEAYQSRQTDLRKDARAMRENEIIMQGMANISVVSDRDDPEDAANKIVSNNIIIRHNEIQMQHNWQKLRAFRTEESRKEIQNTLSDNERTERLNWGKAAIRERLDTLEGGGDCIESLYKLELSRQQKHLVK